MPGCHAMGRPAVTEAGVELHRGIVFSAPPDICAGDVVNVGSDHPGLGRTQLVKEQGREMLTSDREIVMAFGGVLLGIELNNRARC